jgi:hypothetical protein
MELVVTVDGTIRAIYAEEIDLCMLGHPVIARASHVEPNEAGRWIADLAPVSGPILGPFDRRSDALASEQSWLESNWLLSSR